MGMRKNRQRRDRQKDDWKEIPKRNATFEEYYQKQEIVPEEEWNDLIEGLQKPLPISFRITGSRPQTKSVKNTVCNEFFPMIKDITWEGEKIEPPVIFPWYPNKLAMQINVGKTVIRKSKAFSRFQRFLVVENDVGNICRQEAVSMIPPIVLDIKPHHFVIDLCAAPGSKTLQMIEALHLLPTNDGETNTNVFGNDYYTTNAPTGFVIANDSDAKRSHMLVHQVKRLCSPNLIVTNHDAQFYPRIKTQDGGILKFDRILADVPCSGDGTLRKNITLWRDWRIGDALGLHATQIGILMRGIQMLKNGGRIVYSTCSLNPIEDEAVVAEALRLSNGSLRLIDCSEMLPGLKYKTGKSSWKVMNKEKKWIDEYSSEVNLPKSLFPPTKEEADYMGLDKCIRIYPHLQNSGGFFISLLEKVENEKNDSSLNKKRTAEEISLEEQEQPNPKVSKTSTITSSIISEKDLKEPSTSENKVSSDNEKLLVKPKKQRLPRDANEEPFKFIDAENSSLKPCWPFYDINDKFPKECLLVRNATGEPIRFVYYVHPSLKPIIQLNEDKLKFVHSGVKMFAQQKNFGDCQWRVQSEGLPIIFPYLSDKRVVECPLDILKDLCLVEFPRIENLEETPFKEKVESLADGCAFLKVNLKDNEMYNSKYVVFPLWRGVSSINLMLSKKDSEELLFRIFGVENPGARKQQKVSENKAVAEKDETEESKKEGGKDEKDEKDEKKDGKGGEKQNEKKDENKNKEQELRENGNEKNNQNQETKK